MVLGLILTFASYELYSANLYSDQIEDVHLAMVSVCFIPVVVAAILFIIFLILEDSASTRRLLTYVYMLVTISVFLLGFWILIYFEAVYPGGDNVPTELGTAPEQPAETDDPPKPQRSKGNYVASEIIFLIFIGFLDMTSYCWVVKYWVYSKK